MKYIPIGAVVALTLLTAISFAYLDTGAERIAAQGDTTLGIDADAAGNTATSLGEIQSCRRVDLNQTVDVDIFIRDVSELLGWEVWFVYDEAILEVVDKDVKLFQAANQNSNVFDASQSVPDSAGQYRAAAVDIGDNAHDSGNGVLARLTLRAIGTGTSQLSLPQIDPTNGPILTDNAGDRIGDTDGDGLFDGTISSAEIAVGTACPSDTPTDSTPTDGTPTLQDGTPVIDRTPIAAGTAVIIEGTPFIGGTPGPVPTEAISTGAGTPTLQDGTPVIDGTPVAAGTAVIIEGTPFIGGTPGPVPTEAVPSGSGDGPEDSGDGDGIPLWILAPIGAVLLLAGAAAAGILALRRRTLYRNR